MIYRLLADLTLSIHLAFIAFVALGGLLVAWRRWVAWVHLPAAAWGALITFVGWRCPLTPLENRLRRLGGEAGYTESFIEHYIVPVVYPAGIGPTGWTVLGIAVVVVNGVIYGWVYRRARRTQE
jgi:hypothetical protein